MDVFACIDTDWCAVARCDHDCRETSDGSSFICTCRDGYVLNDDGLTCRLVSACRRTDCPTENGGCSKEECFCNSGYHLSDSNTCDRSELATISVTLKVDITTSVPTSELADKTSSGFAALSQDITQELMKKLSGAGRGGISVTVKALRTGSLIIDADVMMDQVGYPNVIKDLAAGLLVVRDSQFTVQGDTGSILQMDINGKRVDSSWTVCEVYQVISPCPAGQQCLVSEGQPVCRSEDSPVTSPGNDDLAIWLGVGIAVLLVIIISVVCLIKRWKKHQKLTGILKDVNNPYIRNVPPHATNANEQPYSSLSRTRSIAEYSTLQLFIVHSPEPHENVSAENTAADYEEPVKISGGVQ